MTEQILFSLPLERLEPIFKGWVRDVIQANTDTKVVVDQDEILTVDEAAEFLKVKRPTIYGYLYNRSIPSIKRRGRVYFKKSALVSWLHEGQRMTRNEISQAAAKSLGQ